MKRRILCVIVIVMMCLGLAVSASATSDLAQAESIHLLDVADILSNTEEMQLTEKLEEVSAKYDAQIVVVTFESTDGSLEELANAVYNMGFGYGQNRDGVLLVVSMDPREYHIIGNGFAGNAVDINAIDDIGEAIRSDLSTGDYADAFDTFADKCEYYLDGYLNGFPFNFGKNLIIALVVGLVIGLIVVLILRGQLKSVRSKNQAADYVKPGSMQVTVARDFFLYRTVTRTKKESNSKSSGSSRSSGGGSF